MKNSSIGPVAFGMKRAQVAKAVGGRPTQFKKKEDAANTTDAFRVGPHHVHVFYSADDVCELVQVSGGGLGGPELDGRGFLNRPYDRALAWLRERDPALVIEDTGCRSHACGVALSSNAEGKVESVAAFSATYGTGT